MCQFCVQHGEGKKWYLEAENYAEDLLSDLRRRSFITDFFANFDREADTIRTGFQRLDAAPPAIARLASWWVTRKSKRTHFGQVVPIEDVERILGFLNSIVRVPCVCRHATLGREERYCFGVSMGPQGGEFLDLAADSWGLGPDTSGFEELDKDEALSLMREFEHDGLLHSVWTFITPFIGGLCNCDRSDCFAMQATTGHDLKMMWKAEYVAQIDWDACTGCRRCMRLCPFGAIGYSAAMGKCFVDEHRCYGCGICRAACEHGAASLLSRSEVPAVANDW